MTTLTTTDTTTGALIIGIVLGAAGVAVLAAVTTDVWSKLRTWFADRRKVAAMDAENRAWVEHPEPFSPECEASIHQALAVAAHWNDAADRLRESNVRLAAVTERMKANPPNLSLVPEPRKPGGLS